MSHEHALRFAPKDMSQPTYEKTIPNPQILSDLLIDPPISWLALARDYGLEEGETWRF
jgi:hypothetical protein